MDILQFLKIFCFLELFIWKFQGIYSQTLQTVFFCVGEYAECDFDQQELICCVFHL